MAGLTGSGFGLMEETVTVPVPTDNGDHDRFSHYVTKEDMMRGMIYGESVTALCGKVWVPSHDGDKFPVCPTCKDIYEGIPSRDNEGGDE
jgi:hypothetical protein